MPDSSDNWVELHRHFSTNWHFRSERPWETVKQNVFVSSALTSVAIYSIVYIYTSEFFWDTSTLTICDRFAVRFALMMIPAILFIVNWLFWRNFKRQCESMYRVSTVVAKIDEKLGLYEEREVKENYCDDKWYIPNDWKQKKHCNSKAFVDFCMRDNGGTYQHLLLLFRLFGALAFIIVGIEIAMLIIHP